MYTIYNILLSLLSVGVFGFTSCRLSGVGVMQALALYLLRTPKARTENIHSIEVIWTLNAISCINTSEVILANEARLLIL